jgi:sodium-dependent dicarboxylate transporter 2/3/5
MSTEAERTGAKPRVDWKRLFFIFLGVAAFASIQFSPPWPDAIDPLGQHFALSREGKGALAVFLLAGIWWVFEVVPIGVTSLAIGILQALFLIRPAKTAFHDFMDPSVMFIFASIVVGAVFTKTGLTRRMAFRMLMVVGDRTSAILLGCFVVTAALTHFMAHTAVAATIYPLLLAINGLYEEGDRPTRFGKSLFMGMAYVAGAGSVITLLGAARGPVAISFFKNITGREITFFELSWFMFPIGWLMVFALWGFFMVVLRPEKKVIPGLRERARELNARLGPITRAEVIAAVIVLSMILIMALRSFLPPLQNLDKTAVILVSTVLFFLLGILDIDDLEDVPWNIILLFGGAMSIGLCLYETEAARWLAINWLTMFKDAHWLIFVTGMAFFVLVMTNFIMNVAAIAISLPVALVMAPYLGVAPEVVFFSSLLMAGMPFVLLVGAAPNAIAYNSNQFTSGEFFKYGVCASLILLVVLVAAVLIIWPLLGMPITLEGGTP